MVVAAYLCIPFSSSLLCLLHIKLFVVVQFLLPLIFNRRAKQSTSRVCCFRLLSSTDSSARMTHTGNPFEFQEMWPAVTSLFRCRWCWYYDSICRWLGWLVGRLTSHVWLEGQTALQTSWISWSGKTRVVSGPTWDDFSIFKTYLVGSFIGVIDDYSSTNSGYIVIRCNKEQPWITNNSGWTTASWWFQTFCLVSPLVFPKMVGWHKYFS